MKVVIIGSGNVATQLSYNFNHHGNISYQVYSRSEVSVELSQLTSNIVHHMDQIDDTAELYIICVSDDAIHSVSKQLADLPFSQDYVVAHTSGTKPSKLLSDHLNYGVCYPLQTLRKDKLILFNDIPLLITGNTDKTTLKLNELSNKLSNRSHNCTDEYRAKLHLPAVLVNNFVNHIYHLAQDYCQKQAIDFKLLMPLIEETVTKMKEGGVPEQIQTGPAIREDFKTINAHISLLKQMDIDSEVYESMTRSILNTLK